MRGKVASISPFNMVSRITPAYAGKSPNYSRVRLRRGDHPRLCGEKVILLHLTSCIPGSPPPMRGKVSLTLAADVCGRITPAYAGKSLDLKWKAKKQQDHPRLCGEKAVLPSKAPQMAGSPPPMRGKAGTPARGLPADGITPAYAGKRIQVFY